MAGYSTRIGKRSYSFSDLRHLMARATALRSGDQLAGLAATTDEERIAARIILADLPLTTFLSEPLIPYETDEVTRLILDSHDPIAFGPISSLTVGEFREWILAAESASIEAISAGVTPEMAAAVSKLMRNSDLIIAAAKISVITAFRNTQGLPGRLGARLQPNHPTDRLEGIWASMVDGLLFGLGDAVIGVNPAGDSVASCGEILRLLDGVRARLEIPTQTCVLAHLTTTIAAIEAGAPVDLAFQSVAGSEAANQGFGVNLALLREGQDATLSLNRGVVGNNVMYFETGQGSALSADAHHGVDQQTMECRAYAVCRAFQPLLVNTVVGFIGPEYLHDSKQIIRAGLEDHFCGKLMGLPMGVDVCYTNHAEADQDDMDVLMTCLGAAGVNFLIAVPGADDIMLNYQSLSNHDVMALRHLLGRRPAPEFEAWLERLGLMTEGRVASLPDGQAIKVLEGRGSLV